MNKWPCVLLLVLSSAASAAEPRTEHTYMLAKHESRPPANLDDASWLVGNWTGSAFGKQFEEIWTAPSKGTMVGMFKLYDDAGVDFYELMLLSIEENSLSLKVKHFSSEFVAWEEKPDFVNFKLVKLEPDALHFSGLSFYRRDENHIDSYIVIRNGEKISEHKSKYVRSDQAH
jgi:hypothetical protein